MGEFFVIMYSGCGEFKPVAVRYTEEVANEEAEFRSDHFGGNGTYYVEKIEAEVE